MAKTFIPAVQGNRKMKIFPDDFIRLYKISKKKNSNDSKIWRRKNQPSSYGNWCRLISRLRILPLSLIFQFLMFIYFFSCLSFLFKIINIFCIFFPIINNYSIKLTYGRPLFFMYKFRNMSEVKIYFYFDADLDFDVSIIEAF